MCLAGFTACGSACADLQSDPNNCGACGQKCPGVGGGQNVCNGGHCATVCAPGRQLCPSGCVIESLDTANCGACGHACSSGEICRLGSCVPPSATFLVTGLNGPIDLAVDATNVYFVDGAGVHFVPKTGGAVKDIAPATGKPVRVAVDDTYAYWSENLAASIVRAPKDGSGTPTLVAAATQPNGLVVDSTQVYWVSNAVGDLSIHRALKAGGPASVLATASQGGVSLYDIATDGTLLFVAEGGSAFAYDKTGAQVDGFYGYLQDGFIIARPGQFCGLEMRIASLVCAANRGIGFDTGQIVTSATLTTCAVAFGMSIAGQSYATYFMPNRDLPAQWNSAYMLAPIQTNLMINDGADVYFIDGSGDIGVLPVP
jgi:hypothetical protein